VSTLPGDVQDVHAQVSKLVNEEKKCRDRTIKGLTELDKEIGDLIINPKHPDEIKQYALMLHDQINQNIGHLKQGKDIEKMPFAVEIIEVGNSKEKTTNSKNKTKDPKAKKRHHKKVRQKEEPLKENNKPSGFIKKLFKWFSSPWSVRWRDL